MLAEKAEIATPRTTAAERLWTACVVHTALEEGLAKIDMAIATYGRREPPLAATFSLATKAIIDPSATTLAVGDIASRNGKTLRFSCNQIERE